MDILEVLRNDHEKVLGLFDQLEQTQESGGKKDGAQDKLFNRLKLELDVHTLGEEEFFYPALREQEDLKLMILEALEQHHVAKLILAEMENMPKNDQWFAKLSVLREGVEQHIDMEEGDIFPEAEDFYDDEQRNAMGRRMLDLKKEKAAHISK